MTTAIFRIEDLASEKNMKILQIWLTRIWPAPSDPSKSMTVIELLIIIALTMKVWKHSRELPGMREENLTRPFRCLQLDDNHNSLEQLTSEENKKMFQLWWRRIWPAPPDPSKSMTTAIVWSNLPPSSLRPSRPNQIVIIGGEVGMKVGIEMTRMEANCLLMWKCVRSYKSYDQG